MRTQFPQTTARPTDRTNDARWVHRLPFVLCQRPRKHASVVRPTPAVIIFSVSFTQQFFGCVFVDLSPDYARDNSHCECVRAVNIIILLFKCSVHVSVCVRQTGAENKLSVSRFHQTRLRRRRRIVSTFASPRLYVVKASSIIVDTYKHSRPAYTHTHTQ